MRDLLNHRGGGHVHYALDVQNNIVPGQQHTAPESETAATTKATDADQHSGNQGQACYDGKLKDFRRDTGDESPVSNDMMNE